MRGLLLAVAIAALRGDSLARRTSSLVDLYDTDFSGGGDGDDEEGADNDEQEPAAEEIDESVDDTSTETDGGDGDTGNENADETSAADSEKDAQSGQQVDDGEEDSSKPEMTNSEHKSKMEYIMDAHPKQVKNCQDKENWMNPHNHGCDWYAQHGHCKFESGIPVDETTGCYLFEGRKFVGELFDYPEKHCCVCGKARPVTQAKLCPGMYEEAEEVCVGWLMCWYWWLLLLLVLTVIVVYVKTRREQANHPEEDGELEGELNELES